MGVLCTLPYLARSDNFFYSVLFSFGYGLLVVPNAIWIIKANSVTSKYLNIPLSKLINGLAIFFTVGFMITWFAMVMMPVSNEIGTEAEWPFIILNTLFPLCFVALIISAILVSRQLIDAESNPKVGRKSRIFVAFLGFFYIAIGMFFIAKRLGKIELSITASEWNWWKTIKYTSSKWCFWHRPCYSQPAVKDIFERLQARCPNPRLGVWLIWQEWDEDEFWPKGNLDRTALAGFTMPAL